MASSLTAPTRASSLTWWSVLGCSLLLGTGFAVCFAPVPHATAAIACLASFFALASFGVPGPLTPRRGAVLGFAFGLGWFGTGISWIYISLHAHGNLPSAMAALATLVFAAFLALFPAAAVALSGKLGPQPGWRRHLALAGLWSLAEWLRGNLLGGFPWLSTGYAQIDGSLAGYAPILGVYGVGTVAAFGAALCAECGLWILSQWRGGRRGHRAIAPALILAVVLLAGARLRHQEWVQPLGPPLVARLVQGNIPQDLKFGDDGLARAETVYLNALETPDGKPVPDLIVFPESAFPDPINDLPHRDLEQLFDDKKRQGAALVFGSFIVEPHSHYFNSAVGLNHWEDDPQRYSKHHLVPFGEFIPFGMHWFVRMLQIPIGDQYQGELVQAPMYLAGRYIAVNICFEALFGEEIRMAWQDPRHPPSVLLNLSNLAWFDDSMALDQHLQISRMRTLETGRPLLQTTNSGLTAAIQADGRVSARVPALQTAALQTAIQPMTGTTPFVRWGNGPILTAILAVLAGLIGLCWYERRRLRVVQ